jgi:SAM-dependent methyltransferase
LLRRLREGDAIAHEALRSHGREAARCYLPPRARRIRDVAGVLFRWTLRNDESGRRGSRSWARFDQICLIFVRKPDGDGSWAPCYKRGMSDEEPIEYDSDGHGFRCRPIACPTCGVDDGRFVGMRGGKYHRYGLGIANRIVRCRRCGLRYANPFPYPVDSQELYGDPEKYFAHQDTSERVGGGQALVREFRTHLRRPLGSLLDVGSGRGEILQAARLEGVERVTGLELSDAMVKHAEQHYGVSVKRQTVEEYAATAPSRFDAVVLSAVLEHVHDPDSMIAAVKKLTVPGSFLYLDIPNETNLLAFVGNSLNKLRGSEAVYNLAPTFPPYHVFGFDPRSLRALLAKHSFQTKKIRIRAQPRIPSSKQLSDRVKALAGMQLMKVANLTRTASNMFVWAERVA